MEVPIIGQSLTKGQKPHGIDTSPARDVVDFRAHTHPVIVKDVGDGKSRIGSFVGIGSSELTDLAGDRMERSALEDMTQLSPDAAGRFPICFIDHNYSFLENCVMGGIYEQPLLEFKQMMDADSGMNKPVAILTIAVEVTTRNPIAAQIFGFIQDKLKVGISVGCQILDYDFITDQDGYIVGLIILHVWPIEFSTVGVPCNKESYVTDAAKGLFKRAGLQFAKSRPDELARMAKSWGDFEGLDQLMLRRLNKAVHLMKDNPRLVSFLSKEWGDAAPTLRAISATVEPLGLGLHRLADVAANTPNRKLYTP